MKSSPYLSSGQAALYSLFFWIGQVLVFVAIGLGLFLVFSQTPKMKSQIYWKAAFLHYARAENLHEALRADFYQKSRQLSLRALAEWPYDADMWFRFANLETKIHHDLTKDAQRAFAIAAQLKPELSGEIAYYKDNLKESYMKKNDGAE